MPAGGFSATRRQEFIADISLANTNTLYMLPTNGGLIPNDRFMYGMFLTFEGRMTNPASGNPTGTQADAPFSLIELIQISGTHRVRGQNELFFSMRGADLYNLLRTQGGFVPQVAPNSTGNPVFTVSLSVSASATNDIRFTLFVPFIPLQLPINSQIGWLLDAPNYDQLQLKITFSDDKSVFTGQTTAPTFTAFGSASGSPRIRVEGLFALGGNNVFGFIPGRVWRYFTENTADFPNTQTNDRLFNIPRGNRIRSVLLKTGVKSTAITAGNNVYNTLSDTILANLRVQRGLNRSIRFYTDFLRLKSETQHAYGQYPATGYAMVDFVQNGRLVEALDTVGLVAGPSGDTDLFIQGDITGASGQVGLFLVEELRGIPQRLGAGRRR